jgi:divalent metal cation (Fe/Co/Zn/Cd) transporter
MSRKAPDSIYPYGYGKFETFGSLSVSALLIAGGVGIGLHSFDLLLATLPQLGAQHLTDAATATVTSSAENSSMISPLSSEPLDPNAAWFALGSVLIKEWLYRASKSI